MSFLEVDKAAFDREETLIRIWNGNWEFFDTVTDEFEHEFEFLNNDAGSATVSLPVDSSVAKRLIDPQRWPHKSMYITFDRGPVRWSGRIQTLRVEVDYKGDQQVVLYAVHDYQKLKELLVWANPFLPAGIQFPKAWVLFGPSRWAASVTLLVNLLRKNDSIWTLPDDPMDIGRLDMSDWSMAVKPIRFGRDSSPTAILMSRFGTYHDCVEAVLKDAELTVDCRRYLEGDRQPIAGQTLRHGCLVIDIKDKSGWNKPTSFWGSLRQGLDRQQKRIKSDGITEGRDIIPRVDTPSEYYESASSGSLPEAPWVVLEHGELTGVESTEFEYTPPGPVRYVTGGSSMPGVNEALKASIIGLGGVIGSLFGQSQAGAVAESLLEPLYTDVFAAFFWKQNNELRRQHGWDYPFEAWADGSDKAYTLNSLSTMRKAFNDSRERIAATVKMHDKTPYIVGVDFFVGDRVAVHSLGMPDDKMYVERVEKLVFKHSDGKPEWEIQVGQPDFTSGFEYMADRFDRTTSALRELGVW